MKCNHCGAEISNDVTECPYCDAVIEKGQPQRDSTYQVLVQQEAESNVAEQILATQNSLIGKKYTFISVSGTNIVGFLNSKIISNVEVAEDRLFIDIKPKRFNTSPAVLFEDIIGIDIAGKINFYYWIWIVLSALGGFAAPYCFIFTLIFILCGLQRKITLSQRNGIKVVMYTHSKSQAEEFKEDMKKVAKIQ